MGRDEAAVLDRLWPAHLEAWGQLERSAVEALFRALLSAARRAELPGCGDLDGATAAALAALLDDPALDRLNIEADAAMVLQLRGFQAALPDPTPPFDARLDAVLREPFAAGPLQDQLAFAAREWTAWLPQQLRGDLLYERDSLAEFKGPEFGGGPPGPPELPMFFAEEDVGEEAFTEDRDWMADCVLIAKHTLVWLHQLSERYDRPIARLDEIPDEELAELRRRGFTGLWLIGLWERSKASQAIKRRRGNPEAAASAYSLWDYAIAESLGGEEGLEALKARAWRHGIRMGADMVPNHVAVDGRWVVEHPEWFVQSPNPPYPNYRFTGPDLCEDLRCTVQIEDGYWDGTDAAVVFCRTDAVTGEKRYIFHGNDGTGLPWNDTAQLDHLNADLREELIQTIVGVARRFPILRFDAAMTLARRHIRRLWHPLPGEGGAIASRSKLGLSPEAFDAAMPHEFWREVVDRCQEEAPDCLLLAEAFWMMESYFVRTLGMHRVYNSAFMHLLRDEKGADYQKLLAEALAFSPAVLERFVNFVSNPDEDPAAAQFGKGDKYFGIATLMATLPGLPMFGHGQMEGLTEKYGMEYARSYVDEAVDDGLLEWHRQRIVPLLYERRRFSGVAWFTLFAVTDEQGKPAPDVYAYANRHPDGGLPTLVLFHNKDRTGLFRLHDSVPFNVASATEPELRTRTLAEVLGIPDDPLAVVAMWELWGQGWRLYPASRLRDEGLWLELGPYETQVVLDVRVLSDEEGRWMALAKANAGKVVRELALPDEDAATSPEDDVAAPDGDAVEDGVDTAEDAAEAVDQDVAEDAAD